MSRLGQGSFLVNLDYRYYLVLVSAFDCCLETIWELGPTAFICFVAGIDIAYLQIGFSFPIAHRLASTINRVFE